MSSLLIRLDPTKLVNPDADIRYLLPDLLARESGGRLTDDGYDYDDQQRLLIFMNSADFTGLMPLVLRVLETQPVLGNTLADTAELAVGGPTDFEVVFPSAAAGQTMSLPSDSHS